jgi:hypothetical protein
MGNCPCNHVLIGTAMSIGSGFSEQWALDAVIAQCTADASKVFQSCGEECDHVSEPIEVKLVTVWQDGDGFGASALWSKYLTCVKKGKAVTPAKPSSGKGTIYIGPELKPKKIPGIYIGPEQPRKKIPGITIK